MQRILKVSAEQHSVVVLPYLCRAPGEKRVNRLVFIGRHLDRAALNDSFRSCLASSAAAA
jgi:G3E family GTPase